MTYLSTVLADAPLHYWRCAEIGGALLHDIGSSPRHVAIGPIVPGNLSYSGISSSGGAVWIDVGMGFFCGDPVPVSSPVSVELWAWLIANTQTVRGLFDHGGSANVGIDVSIASNDHWGADWAAGHVAGPAAVPQTWHHLVATYAAPTLSFYVDSVLAGTAVNATAAGSATLQIGKFAAGGIQFSAGALAEVAYYSTALSAGRVAAHYAAREISGSPIFNQSGYAGLTGGAGGGPTDSLSVAIYNAVHKTF